MLPPSHVLGCAAVVVAGAGVGDSLKPLQGGSLEVGEAGFGFLGWEAMMDFTGRTQAF